MVVHHEELWAHIPGNPKYLISSYGNVKSEKTGLYIQPSINQQGHLKVNLMRHGALVTRSVSQLTARAFLEAPTRREFNSVIHLDGDKQNCMATNLAWRSRYFAIRYHQQFHTKLYARANQRVVDVDSGEEFPSPREAAMTYGLLVSDIIVSSYARTFVWPTFQMFRLVED